LCQLTIAAMKNSTTYDRFRRAIYGARQGSSADRNAGSAAALVFLFIAILSTSGCIGLTGATNKTTSSQQTAPGTATISVAPASIKFGSVALGDTSSQSVTISNSGGSNATITKASVAGTGISVTGVSFPLTIASGKQATLNVVFSPKTAGAVSGDVSIVSDASSSPSTVSVSGTGMAATALLTTSVSSLNFGSITIGKNSVLSVTLTNAGNSNVTVSKVSFSGADYSGSGVSAGLILSPGQSATLNETFTPVSAGNFTGSVTVGSNASNSPATISLSGVGTQLVSHAVVLSWNPSTSVVSGYNVLRSEISGGPYSKLDSSIVPTESYTDSTVQAGRTYYYVVTAVTSAGIQSVDSTQVSAIVPSP
jgi:Abnormal spindle-like microcephaly-assoc'd, ASPM-SPD-2-Hydin